MTFTLSIDSDSDALAFDDSRSELSRIVRGVADRIGNGELRGSVRDINGNTVGHYETKEN